MIAVKETLIQETNVNDLINSAVKTNNIQELRKLITDKNYQHDHLMLNSLYCEKMKVYTYLLGVKSRTIKVHEDKFPLHKAILEGNIELIERLIIENKKLIDTPDKFNRTPLYNAVDGGNVNVVKTILRYDINPNNMISTNNSSYTIVPNDNPLLLAVVRGETEIVKCLISHRNIQLNITNDWQQTPLILSVLYNRLDIFKLLYLQGNTDKTQEDKFQMTYRDYIVEKKREDMYSFL